MTAPRIITTHVYPPIPIRQFDWQAHYEGEEDEQMDTGHGATEAEAVVDLIVNHPRGGIECERDRRCATCLNFTEEATASTHDDPPGTQYVCGLHTVCGGWYRRPVNAEDTCSDHEFEGERGLQRTLPLLPVDDDIKF